MITIMEALLGQTVALVVAVGLTAAVGDSFFNQYADRGGIGWLLAGYAVWIISATFFVFLLREQNLGKGIVLFTLSNVLFGLILGRVFFSEHLSIVQWFGVVIAVAAITMLSLAK